MGDEWYRRADSETDEFLPTVLQKFRWGDLSPSGLEAAGRRFYSIDYDQRALLSMTRLMG
jgi:hypothetical protein